MRMIQHKLHPHTATTPPTSSSLSKHLHTLTSHHQICKPHSPHSVIKRSSNLTPYKQAQYRDIQYKSPQHYPMERTTRNLNLNPAHQPQIRTSWEWRPLHNSGRSSTLQTQNSRQIEERGLPLSHVYSNEHGEQNQRMLHLAEENKMLRRQIEGILPEMNERSIQAAGEIQGIRAQLMSAIEERNFFEAEFNKVFFQLNSQINNRKEVAISATLPQITKPQESNVDSIEESLVLQQNNEQLLNKLLESEQEVQLMASQVMRLVQKVQQIEQQHSREKQLWKEKANAETLRLEELLRQHERQQPNKGSTNSKDPKGSSNNPIQALYIPIQPLL